MLKDAASYRRHYQDVSGDLAFTTTTDDTTLVTGRAGHTIYVQRVIVVIKTDAAQSITFEDSNGTPVFVEKTDSSPGANARYEWVFGDKGKPLTEAKNFVANFSAVGLAGHIEWEAYIRQTATLSVSAKSDA